MSKGIVGRHKYQIDENPSNKKGETPRRHFQMGTKVSSSVGEHIGGNYVGKRKIHGLNIFKPGNVHAKQNLIDVTSKEVQVGRIKSQGTSK